MIIHERFVFLEMRRTASTFLSRELRQALSSEIRDGPADKHADWAKIPREAAGLPVLTYVRNPWDWYVSWYHRNLQPGGASAFWSHVSAGGSRDFAATVRRAYGAARGVMGGDLYVTLFRNLVGDGLESERLTVGRFESLVGDLDRFLVSAGVNFSRDAISEMRAKESFNSSMHGPYRDYYDESLRDLVHEACWPLIDRFGYRF